MNRCICLPPLVLGGVLVLLSCGIDTHLDQRHDAQAISFVSLRMGRIAEGGTQSYRLDPERGKLDEGLFLEAETEVVRWGNAGRWAMVAPSNNRAASELAHIDASEFVFIDATQVYHPADMRQLGEQESKVYRASTVFNCGVFTVQGTELVRFSRNSRTDRLQANQLQVKSRGLLNGYLLVELSDEEVAFVSEQCTEDEGPWISDHMETTPSASHGIVGKDLLTALHGQGPQGRGPNATTSICTSPTRPGAVHVAERDPYEFIRDLMAKIPEGVRSQLQSYWQNALQNSEDGRAFASNATTFGLGLSNLTGLQSKTKSVTVKKTLFQLQSTSFENTLSTAIFLLNEAGRALRQTSPQAPDYLFYVQRTYDTQGDGAKRFRIITVDTRQSLNKQFSRPSQFQSADASLQGGFYYYIKLDVARILDRMTDKLEELGDQRMERVTVVKKTTVRRSHSWFKDEQWLPLFIKEMHAQFAKRPLVESYELFQNSIINQHGEPAEEFYLVPGTIEHRLSEYAKYTWNQFLEYVVVHNILSRRFGYRELIQHPDQLIELVKTEANATYPGLGDYLEFETEADGHVQMRLDLNRLTEDGLGWTINQRSEEELRRDARMVWEKLLARVSREPLHWQQFAGSITVGDPDIFLGLLRELADETYPGLGQSVQMCWLGNVHTYSITVEEPRPDPSILK